MGIYSYFATDAGGHGVRGTIAAESPRQARDQLRSQGLVPQTLAERLATVQAAPLWSVSFWVQRPNPAEVAAVLRELGLLLSVGVALHDALKVLLAQHGRSRCRTTLLQLGEQVAAGVSLTQALAAHPDVFDPLVLQMVDVGERSGHLDQTLSQLTEFLDRRLLWQDRLLTALLYPAIVLASALFVSIFLMTVIVPSLLSSLVEAGRTLPWPTWMLQWWSSLLVIHWPELTVGGVGLVGMMGWWLRSERGQWTWHRWLLRWPVIGPLAHKQALTRLSLVLTVLLRSGIEVLQALELAARSCDNLVLRQGLSAACGAVRTGAELGPALERAGVFSPLEIQIFAIGQQTGRLEEMLEKLAADYDRQVVTLAARLTSLVEPALIVLLSVLVGFILFATILPILDAGNVL
jgi:general secretion pathway protein F